MNWLHRLAAFQVAAVLGGAAACAQGLSAGEAEVQKCEERIAAAQRDVLGKYEAALQDLQLKTQKAADLESALAVREELRRVAAEQTLAEKDILPAPEALRALQRETFGKMQSLVTQLVQETLPKLIELKKSLTVAGQLDDAVAVRGAIERLQDTHLPIVKADGASLVTAETLLMAYAADRSRADKIYKGQRIIVRGIVGGFRPDAGNARVYHLFLTGGASGGWVQCVFGGEVRFREERGPLGAALLVITGSGGETVRAQKGQTFDLRGVCDGFDETVRMKECELFR